MAPNHRLKFSYEMPPRLSSSIQTVLFIKPSPRTTSTLPVVVVAEISNFVLSSSCPFPLFLRLIGFGPVPIGYWLVPPSCSRFPVFKYAPQFDFFRRTPLGRVLSLRCVVVFYHCSPLCLKWLTLQITFSFVFFSFLFVFGLLKCYPSHQSFLHALRFSKQKANPDPPRDPLF